ncbi:hypothetical protein F2Q69_00025723 [Brassica cretica]|uniref:Transmembrane protein n=1 Tax=Brassica cretica TaxID=69181 RepID=A0A8S9RY83_BRACR|nr:hypothetical protein F2Q69_00025723 [Brassica cretica]
MEEALTPCTAVFEPDEVNLDVAPQKTRATKAFTKEREPKAERQRERSLQKKPSPRINHHLETSRLSIGFAGTGIAVFFSVVCNAASGRVPFCANKVFEAGLCLSLVLLSRAVSRLREAIVGINSKVIKGEEITNRVESRIKDVYLRAATVIIMVALRTLKRKQQMNGGKSLETYKNKYCRRERHTTMKLDQAFDDGDEW